MTSTLYAALNRMSVIREGFVVRDLDGSAKADGQASWTMARMCRNAGLPVRYWHTLRHYPDRRIIPRRYGLAAVARREQQKRSMAHAG